VLEIIENLGTRHYAIAVLAKTGDQALSRLPPYSLYETRVNQDRTKSSGWFHSHPSDNHADEDNTEPEKVGEEDEM